MGTLVEEAGFHPYADVAFLYNDGKVGAACHDRQRVTADGVEADRRCHATDKRCACRPPNACRSSAGRRDAGIRSAHHNAALVRQREIALPADRHRVEPFEFESQDLHVSSVP